MKAKIPKHITKADFQKPKKEKEQYHQITIKEYLQDQLTSNQSNSKQKAIENEIAKMEGAKQ